LDWQHDLNQTRPITLLETVKKTFTKIINNRLARILSRHQILSLLNWARLPGGGTHEPIIIINHIMEEARESGKELWMLSRDISKAYDSMRHDRLDQAMERINIPQTIRDIIMNCVTERTSQVITQHGLTEPFTIRLGIDQGDTISPLLWRIYYDPLIKKIEDLKLGYNLDTKIPTTCFGHWNQGKVHISSISYMDDTTWFTNSKKKMKKILSLVESFANIAGLKINPNKSALLTINNTKQSNIMFQTSTIQAQEKDTAIRILGTWITSKGSKKHQKQLITNKTNFITKLLCRKKITDKQYRYIINQVLMPALEYLIQDTILTQQECNHINSKIISTFKHKLGLPWTAINSGIYLHTGYKIFNIYDRQLKLQTTRWLQDLNAENITGLITRARLQHLQNWAWTTNNILDANYRITSPPRHNLSAKILLLLKENNLHINTTEKHQLTTPIPG